MEMVNGDHTLKMKGATWESEQLEKARSGDRDAFAQIVAVHWGEARRFARHLVGRDDADDLTSDVFERLLAALVKGLGPRDAVRPYLFRMIRNAAIDQYRKRREITPSYAGGDRGSPSDEYHNVLESRLIREAFASLPARWQQVLWLSYVEQHDRSEVAAELGIRPGAVSQLTLRAREGFRLAYLAEYARFTDEVGDAHPTELFSTYVIGKASPDQSATVEDHLRACQPCSDAIVEMKAMTRGLGVALLTFVGPVLGAFGWRFVSTLASGSGLQSTPLRRQVPALATVLAVVTASLLLGLDYLRRSAVVWADPATRPTDASPPTEPRRPAPPAPTLTKETPEAPPGGAQQERGQRETPKAAPPYPATGPAVTVSPTPSPMPAPTSVQTSPPAPTVDPTPTAPGGTTPGGEPTEQLPSERPSWEQPSPPVPSAVPVPTSIDPRMPPEYVVTTPS